jgi:hypothetical protein
MQAIPMIATSDGISVDTGICISSLSLELRVTV